MNTRSRSFWSAVVVGSFLFGLLLGLVLAGKIASAAQEFGPKDVASVPDTFLKGGDRSYTVLREIETEVAKHSELLEQIAASAEDLNKTAKATLDAFKNPNRTRETSPKITE